MDINEQFESLMETSVEINEASEVEIKDMDKKAQLAIKYWTKLFHGKPESAWDGIHGLIINIRVSSVINRLRPETLANLVKGPEYRWIEFDERYIQIGF